MERRRLEGAAVINYLEGAYSGMEDDGGITVLVGGVGYRVFVSDRDRAGLNTSAHINVWCRSIYREDNATLYGFIDFRDRRAFDRLMQVDGVGPSVALKVLSILDATSLADVVKNKLTGALMAVPGVGRKTAERILEQVKL